MRNGSQMLEATTTINRSGTTTLAKKCFGEGAISLDFESSELSDSTKCLSSVAPRVTIPWCSDYIGLLTVSVGIDKL